MPSWSVRSQHWTYAQVSAVASDCVAASNDRGPWALVEEYQSSGEVSGFGVQESALCHVLHEVVQRPRLTADLCEECGLYSVFENMEDLGSMSAFGNVLDFLAATLFECTRGRRVKLFQKDGDGRRSASTLAFQPPSAPCSPSPFRKDI